MGANKYVLAKDSDFKKDNLGFFIYVGKEPYVKIPHRINGKLVTEINHMFKRNTIIKGVKSTNKKITSIVNTFDGCKCDELDLSEFNAESVRVATWAFINVTAKNIIFPKTGFPKLKDGLSMFYASKIEKLDLSQLNLPALTAVESMFNLAVIDTLILPTDGSFAPERATTAFNRFTTKILDLTNLDTTRLSNTTNLLANIRADKIVWPASGSEKLLKSSQNYYPLKYVPKNSQTEAICRSAILDNEKQRQFVKIKNKKILARLDNKYFLAKNSDFKQEGKFLIYIGKKPYVEIPHTINGKPVTSIDYMFRDSATIKGVKSTNKGIISMSYAFNRCKCDTLDLSEFEATSVTNAAYAFYGLVAKNIIFPSTGLPRLQSSNNAFAFSIIEKLDLSQLNLSEITTVGSMFAFSTIQTLKLPADGSFAPEKADYIFRRLETKTLNLTNFNTKNLSSMLKMFGPTMTNKIIWPISGLEKLLKSGGGYCLLRHIPRNKQTEEICWLAVLDNKKQGKFVKVKSKKILMYLGTECPEYIDFYYNN